MAPVDNTNSASFLEREDFENASRGFIDSLKPCTIRARDGNVVWDNDQYSFLEDKCPGTVNPSLWRQAQLCYKQGLFEVARGIYQVRGFDLSNMTVVEGQQGVIVIDPLISAECAAAALALYRQHRGNRKVTGLIYSHSHVDHFGGAAGVLPSYGLANESSTTESVSIPILAPEHFMDEAISENIFAGPAMRRRAAFMFGNRLAKGSQGQVSSGLGLTSSSGTTGLIPPNVDIKLTGEEHVLDGVRIVFQMVPGTEAPAEINLYFPEQRALCISECATHCMHNIGTLRGAQVRDAKAWSKYLDESLALFGNKSDVLFASHHWPTWGQEKLIQLISEQRDLYAYLHDQTCRMMNLGLTGTQIAERLQLPTSLQKAWHIKGYYGSLSHNVKAIYQRYMTWFDGNAAHLWQHPPENEAKRYVDCMGGVESVVRKALAYRDNGDLRFAATLLDHALFTEPTPVVREASASVFERLGYGTENAIWRNFYLTRAQDIRNKVEFHISKPAEVQQINPFLSVADWLDCISIQLDGSRVNGENITIDILMPDEECRWTLSLSNGALTYREKPIEQDSQRLADLILNLTKGQLADVLQGDLQVIEQAEGDLSVLSKLLGFLSIGIRGRPML
jgi:alkyl sulfatase BDS1-like metallo-beta-lactamase superfamily hydrolase